MTVTVVGNDIKDVKSKIGANERDDISINFRGNRDYGRRPAYGATIKFSYKKEVREFDTSNEVIEYLRLEFVKRDAAIEEENKRQDLLNERCQGR